MKPQPLFNKIINKIDEKMALINEEFDEYGSNIEELRGYLNALEWFKEFIIRLNNETTATAS